MGRNKVLAITGLALIFLVMGSHLIISGRAAGDVTKAEAKRIAEERMGGAAKNARAISAEKETDEGEDNAYYDVMVENDEGVWEVEVYCSDGHVGEIEGPDADEPDDEDDDDD